MRGVLTILIFITLKAHGQAVLALSDAANKGQLQRQVFERRDNWAPKGPVGAFYWKVLHRKYYKGGDLRPYRIAGPFEQNYLSLKAQQKQEAMIRDSLEAMAADERATYVSMMGGAMDFPWNFYYADRFRVLQGEVTGALKKAKRTDALAVMAVESSEGYKQYKQYVEVATDRLKTLHEAFLDMGERMLAYSRIEGEWEVRNKAVLGALARAKLLARLPDERQVKRTLDTIKIKNSDEAIYKDILKRYNRQ